MRRGQIKKRGRMWRGWELKEERNEKEREMSQEARWEKTAEETRRWGK